MKKILLVDDDPIIVRIYQSKLQIEGFLVNVALDGERALAALAKDLPDLILLDLQLPKLPGIDVLKQVRAHISKTVPMIVFTNSAQNDLIQQAWASGATKVLVKSSCPPKKLLEEISSALLQQANLAAAPTEPARKSAPPTDPLKDDPKPLQSAHSEADLRADFRQAAERSFSEIQQQLRCVLQTGDETARRTQVAHLARAIDDLAAQAGVAGIEDAAVLAHALEALLNELASKPVSMNASTLRSVAQALDTLNGLIKDPSPKPEGVLSSVLVMAIDDDTICRRAIRAAMNRAKLRLITLDNAEVALKLLSENRFDLIFVDIEMPQMTGFEFCSKARALPSCHDVPIVFVTRLDDLDNRAESLQMGGSGLIGKPFPVAEMSLKALTYLLARRVQPIPPRSNAPLDR